MKRDARIGLAVVLVLGLSVTLLVARALHSRASKMESEGDPVAKQNEPAGAAAEAHAAETTGPGVAQTHDQAVRDFVDTHADGTPNRNAGTNPGVRAEVLDSYSTTGGAHGTPQPGTSIHPASSEFPNAGASLDAGAPAGNNANLQTNGVRVSAPTGWTYTPVAGDTAAKISTKVFGDERQAQKITAANPSLTFSHLKAGQKVTIPALPGLKPKLTLPALEAAAPARTGGSTPVAGVERSGMTNQEWEGYQSPVPNEGAVANRHLADASAATTYLVKTGDTVAAIAKAHYGSSGPKLVQRILDANPGLDPKRLKVGASLKIPAPLP